MKILKEDLLRKEVDEGRSVTACFRRLLARSLKAVAGKVEEENSDKPSQPVNYRKSKLVQESICCVNET